MLLWVLELLYIALWDTQYNMKKPTIAVINGAARVGGIYANNTKRSEFLIENLKINLNLLEVCIPFPDIKIIN